MMGIKTTGYDKVRRRLGVCASVAFCKQQSRSAKKKKKKKKTPLWYPGCTSLRIKTKSRTALEKKKDLTE